MNRLRLRYFAVFREERGLSEEVIETAVKTAGELYNELRQKHGFRLDPSLVRVALNGHYVGMDASLGDDDEVVLIPPVAGG